MRLGWLRRYVVLAWLSASLSANASSIQCANEANVVHRPFPDGAVIWSVTTTPDSHHPSDELTVDVVVDIEIDGKIFGVARVYVGEQSGQNFDLQTSEMIPVHVRDDEVPGILVSFGTSASIDRPVTLKFWFIDKSPCPEEIIVYELALSEVLDSDGAGKAGPDN